ncbi:MAG: 50S ribosomal protein L3 [Clostridiales bacterium]|jgi:large subunit ribosomal protein L3|nr:50S ribosomal protein L3 [Clostridiales bacterium]MDD2571736.1 50S ribosomal protein L3 [Eubacteriales bacterium]MDY0119218.1 50S ribosomal protein L3 [Clostridia bacterium]NLG30576.1 50S ribosomal protein L3 [Clostridiaceae bacterium]MCK9349980.1 50S ribosomal protein L3 [Clostridiales bacterium]
MAKFMLGRKAGMTQIFDENGLAIPVTVIACGPLTVIQNKTVEKEGYQAVRVGYEETKKGNRPHKGQFEKIGVNPMRVIREFHTTDAFETGQTIAVSEMFEVGDAVDVTGTSKGKGYQGGIRRHGMRRGPSSHGSKYHRKAGPMSSAATPGKVFKGKKLPGQLGYKRVTVQNLDVVQVDGERHFLVVKGAVPGPKGGLVEIKTTVKAKA